MKIIANQKKIQRNAKIGQMTTLASLVILGGGFYLSLTSKDMAQFNLIWLALVLGFILSQVGIYYGNRWGRHPRQDELIDKALEGLDGRYSIYHFEPPVPHLLVGPAGVWVLSPQHQSGTIVYQKNRWRQKGAGCLQAYLRLFAQEGLGRPDLELAAERETVERFLNKRLPEGEVPPVHTVLVFTNDRAVVDAPEAPIPAVNLSDLKDFIRKSAKDTGLPQPKVKQLQAALEGTESATENAKTS